MAWQHLGEENPEGAPAAATLTTIRAVRSLAPAALRAGLFAIVTQ